MRAPAAGKDKGGEYDVYVTFLTTHLVVERAREALLWAWVVARVGGVDGEWGVTERRRAWEEVGGRWEKERPEGVVAVMLTERGTVKGERVRTNLEASGVEESEETTYLFCESLGFQSSVVILQASSLNVSFPLLASLDGYPYAYKNPQGETIAPQFSGPSLGQKLCTIEYETCFGREVKSAEEAFKRIAFERVECGDCGGLFLLRALLTLMCVSHPCVEIEQWPAGPERVSPSRLRRLTRPGLGGHPRIRIQRPHRRLFLAAIVLRRPSTRTGMERRGPPPAVRAPLAGGRFQLGECPRAVGR